MKKEEKTQNSRTETGIVLDDKMSRELNLGRTLEYMSLAVAIIGLVWIVLLYLLSMLNELVFLAILATAVSAILNIYSKIAFIKAGNCALTQSLIDIQYNLVDLCNILAGTDEKGEKKQIRREE